MLVISVFIRNTRLKPSLTLLSVPSIIVASDSLETTSSPELLVFCFLLKRKTFIVLATTKSYELKIHFFKVNDLFLLSLIYQNASY